jgi:hypothetical protein
MLRFEINVLDTTHVQRPVVRRTLSDLLFPPSRGHAEKTSLQIEVLQSSEMFSHWTIF